MRPQSIVIFERCYLGAWLVGLVNTVLNWTAMSAALDANPSVEVLGPSVALGIVVATLVIGAVITLTLWYFVARRGSNVARWIVTILFALGLLSFLRGMLVGGLALGELGRVFGVVALVLQAVAVWMLFRADAKPWFAASGREPGEPFA